MTMHSSKIYKGIDREKIVLIETLHPKCRVTFMVRSLMDFQTLHRHKINTTTTGNMKTRRYTKNWVLNPDWASIIAYERSLNNLQDEAVNQSGLYTRYKFCKDNTEKYTVKCKAETNGQA